MNHRALVICVTLVLASVLGAGAQVPLPPDPVPPPPKAPQAPAPPSVPAPAVSTGTPAVTSQITFLYYKDLDKAAAFYSQTLGFKPALDLDWVKIFTVTPSSSIGLVDATSGARRPSNDKPVMISLAVDDVDRWYDYLASKGVRIREAPKNSDRVNVRSFAFTDPEGYSIEVFSWVKN